MKAGADDAPSRAASTPRTATPPPTHHHADPPARATSVEPKPDHAHLTHETLWTRTLESVGEKPSALARLESISLVRLEGSVAVVRPVGTTQPSRIRAGAAWFEARFTEAAGRPIRVKVEAPEIDDAAPAAPSQPGLDDAALRREAESNKLVRTAIDLFQARLLRIEDAPPSTPHPPDDATPPAKDA